MGKSSLAALVAELVPDLVHLEASRLLRRAHHQSAETLRTSSPARLRRNQDALAHEVREERRGREERPVLITAHSVIDNDAGLVAVPFEAIEPLGIGGFFFLRAAPGVLAVRRGASDRARPRRDAPTLAVHQEVALETCRCFATSARAKFLVLDATHPGTAAEMIARFLRCASSA